MKSSDTIVAPATALARSALAVVRIDGPGSHDILRHLLRDEVPRARHATRVRLYAGEELLDECVALLYEGPRSFTGNDLVEVTLHGSPWIVNRVVAACTALGARIAEPGEFTERAVLNGKLDLVQAESVADLINSRTELQAKLALSNLEGMLSRRIASVRERLLDMMARLEAALDFSEEGYDFIGSAEVAEGVKVALEELEELAGTFVRGRATVGGIEAAILGRPNAGKSTLLNRLIGTDRAIVTPIAGTTRDILRESIEIGGLPVVLMDTAGLRNNADVVEEIGIARAREAARRAEIVIYLVDSAVGMTDEDLSELRMLADPVVVFTKSDLVSRHEAGLSISVNNNSGIDRLLSVLDTRVRERYAAADGALVNERQLSAVRTACRHLRLVQSSLEQGAPETLLLVDLRATAASLAALMGEITTDEIFAEIFGKFCIGK